MRIHFIGVCGVAMSALAIAFQKNGWKVSGSDAGFFPPISDHLKKNKIYFYPGWHPEKMMGDGRPDIVVVGNVAGSSNPEFIAARENNLNYKSYPEIVAEYIVQDHSLVCAGTYGKTTNTALLTLILTKAKLNPSYMFGGLSLNIEDSANLTLLSPTKGEGGENKPDLAALPQGVWAGFLDKESAPPTIESDCPLTPTQASGYSRASNKKEEEKAVALSNRWSVLEGDEYKTSRWDNRPKFLLYSPTHLLLTAASWDHADLYPTEKDYLHAFKNLIKMVPEKGLIVACTDGKNIPKLMKETGRKYVSYGRDSLPAIPGPQSGAWQAGSTPPYLRASERSLGMTVKGQTVRNEKNGNADYVYGNIKQSKNGMEFKIKTKNKEYDLKTPSLGEHMAENICGCFAMAKEIGVEEDKILEAISEFRGIKRRLEKRLGGKITIYDDLAHSPAKARAALKTLRTIYPKNKIIAIFEPNTGNRQPQSEAGYKNAFSDADEVIIPTLTKIKSDPTDLEKPFAGEKLSEIISQTHKNVKFIRDDKELVAYVARNIKEDKVVVFLGSHGFRGMIEELVKAVCHPELRRMSE